MTTLDDTLPAKVIAVLATYGKPVTFVVPGAYVYNVASGDGRTLSKVKFTHQVSPPFPYDIRLWNRDTIREHDLKTLVEATGLSFEPSDKVVVQFDDKEYRIVSVQKIYSGVNIVAYELQLRA